MLRHWRRLQDAQLHAHWAAKRQAVANPLVRCGRKYFSQSDEDGILLEICRRIGLRDGVFAEFGVGNGLENNTLILLMRGWQGLWIGGEKLAFDVPENARLRFVKAFVDRDNCGPLLEGGLCRGKPPNVLSIDLDGNDLHVLEALLLANHRPEVIVVEYNAKFPPPIAWTVGYDAKHRWDGSDYFGASLQSFVDLAAGFDYRLVACNITGANAFFVSNSFGESFVDVSTDIGDLYQEADYTPFPQNGHATSPRTIARFLGSQDSCSCKIASLP